MSAVQYNRTTCLYQVSMDCPRASAQVDRPALQRQVLKDQRPSIHDDLATRLLHAALNRKRLVIYVHRTKYRGNSLQRQIRRQFPAPHARSECNRTALAVENVQLIESRIIWIFKAYGLCPSSRLDYLVCSYRVEIIKAA